MGAQLSEEKFEKICAPIMKKAQKPPAFFRPQRVTQKCAPLNAVVEMAFLPDGTIAGNATIYRSVWSVAIRGTYHVDADTKHVTTHVELSCDEGTSEMSSDMNHLIVLANGELAPRERQQPMSPSCAASPASAAAAPDGAAGFEDAHPKEEEEREIPPSSADENRTKPIAAAATDLDAEKRTFEVEFLSEIAFAQQFLPPLKTEAELAEEKAQLLARDEKAGTAAATRRRSSKDPRTAQSEAALTAALSALGVLAPDVGVVPAAEGGTADARFFVGEDEFNAGDEKKKKQGSADCEECDDSMVSHSGGGNRSVSRVHGRRSSRKKGGAASSPGGETVLTGSPGGRSRSTSPFSVSRNSRDGSVRRSARRQQHRQNNNNLPPKRLFERIGSYTVPVDHDDLKELFDEWSLECSGADFIPRDVFVRDLLEFEAEMGLEVSAADLERLFDKCDRSGAGQMRDGKMSFGEFELAMLERSRK